MKKIKISLVDVYEGFWTDSLVPRMLSSRHQVELVSDHKKADLILRGSIPEKRGKYLKCFNPKRFKSGSLNLRQKLDPLRNKIWIHVSGESPFATEIASFKSSECDFGVGHEISTDQNYLRVPLWMGSIDWTFEGLQRVDNITSRRLGGYIDPFVLTRPIDKADFFSRSKKVAFFAGHLRGHKRFIYEFVRSIVEVDCFGRAFKNKKTWETGESKLKTLRSFRFSLCPGNTLFPGYCTEKTPEAYAANCIPLAFFDATAELDFQQGSYINVLDHYAQGSATTLSEAIECPEKATKVFETPLLAKTPTLQPLDCFLEYVLKQIH